MLNKDQPSLQALLAERSYWIYTDGSAKTTGVRSGSYAAMILETGALPILVAGACNEATINRMELLAVNSDLPHERIPRQEYPRHPGQVGVLNL